MIYPRFFRRWLNILLIVAVALIGFGLKGAAQAQNQVTLTVMIDPSSLSDPEIQGFMDANPDITVNRIPFDATRLNAMFAAGNPPDVFKTSGADIPNDVAHGWLLDLKPYFENSQVLKPDDLIQLPFQYFQDQGGWYGMNTDWSPDNSIFINTAAFKDAGLAVPDPSVVPTYAQVGDWAHALTQKRGDRVVRMGWDSFFSDAILQTILMENGQDLYSDDFKQAHIKDNPLAVDVLQFFAGLAKDDVTWNPLDPSQTWGGDDFLQGHLGGVNYGYWYHGQIVTTPDSPLKPEDVLMLRGPSWSGTTSVNIPFGGNGASIAKTSGHPDQAWQFFEYYMGGAPAVTRAQSGWGVPALTSLLAQMPQATAFDKQTFAMVQTEIASNTTVRRINPYYSTDVFNTSWSTNLERYLKGEITFDQLVANLDGDVNKAIQEGAAAS